MGRKDLGPEYRSWHNEFDDTEHIYINPGGRQKEFKAKTLLKNEDLFNSHEGPTPSRGILDRVDLY